MQKMLGIKIPSRPMGVQETVTIVDPAAETGSGGGGDFNLREMREVTEIDSIFFQ